MRYLHLDIDISTRGQSLEKEIKVIVKDYHFQAFNVSYDMPHFFIGRGVRTTINDYSLCIQRRYPLPEEVANGQVYIKEQQETSLCLGNEVLLNRVLGRLLRCLYFWDRRCSRSINVNPKVKEDTPITLRYGGMCYNISLKDMILFADFISNEN